MIASLTQKQAENRFASFKGDLSYNFYLNLCKGESYNGLMECHMTLQSTSNIFVDFSGQEIVMVTVNGKQVSKDEVTSNWKDGQLTIDPKHLQEGDNRLEVQFNNQYDTDGNGLHTSLDSDGDQFIYCQNEPYHLNRVLPIFDQPDLKARATFHIVRPNDWQVISNTTDECSVKATEFNAESDFEKRVQELCQDNLIENKSYMRFGKTDKLPTYLYCFVAGPYQVVNYDNSDGPAPVPMRIFCNKQNLPYVEKQQRDIFLYYIKAIEFYEKFFQTKFQFKKNDTVFCPEYTVGAMEYPGVITYTDRLVWKQDNPTPAQVTLRGGVIVHELAHMWFGNYVTMKWWNDLWLNESFADFARYFCQSQIDKNMPFETTDSWTNMLIRKGWGYLEDKRISTHPIACVVENTSKADSIFDGITYAKGAAVLKQLYFLIGYETFSNNLKSYFEKYAWSNATLSQFLEEIQKPGSTKNEHKAYDVQNFNKDWIETAGLNEVQLQWDPVQQGKVKLVFKQSCHSKDHPKLRYNKLKLACFDKDANIVHTQEFILENQEETEVEIENKNYSAILPNYEDWGFIKVILDKHSEEFFLNNMHKLNDTLSTLLVVRSFYDAIFDGKMKATDFVDKMVETKFLEQLFGNSTLMDATMKFFSAALSFVHWRFKDEYYNKAFEEVSRLYMQASSTNDKTMLRAKMVEYAKTVKSIDSLKNLYELNCSMNFTLSEKWNIVYKVNSSSLYSNLQKKIFTEGMKALDGSDTGKQWLLSIDALTNDKETLRKLWEEEYFNKDRTLSYTKVGCSMRGFYNSLGFSYNKHQYVKRYFEDMVNVCNNQPKEFGKTMLVHSPPWKNRQYLIDNYKILLNNIKPERQFFLDNIKKIISDLENLQNVDKLYEN